MRYGQYIREHKLWVVIFTCLLCSVEIFLLTVKGSGWLMVYVAAACVVGFLLGTFVDYKGIKPVIGTAHNNAGTNFIIIGILLIQSIEFTQCV